MRAWLLIVKSESGDEYGPYVFPNKKPIESVVEKFLRKSLPEEFTEKNNGPGDFGSYLYTEIKCIEI